jgi:hypothetical protein
MSRYLIIRYELDRQNTVQYGLECFFIEGLSELSSIIEEAKLKGMSIVEDHELDNECDLKLHSSNRGCLVIIRVN